MKRIAYSQQMQGRLTDVDPGIADVELTGACEAPLGAGAGARVAACVRDAAVAWGIGPLRGDHVGLRRLCDGALTDEQVFVLFINTQQGELG